ncbi:MAG: formylglycine-generating enzyme family protein [Pseudomonadota bacterium]
MNLPLKFSLGWVLAFSGGALVASDTDAPLVAAGTHELCLPAGEFLFGSNDHYPEERAARRVTVDAFCIDRYEVTNAQFAQFVAATGYVTLAERGPSREAYPNAPEDFYQPGSAVFVMPQVSEVSTLAHWWQFREQAYWRDVDGDGEQDAADDHPVVHVAYEDALAFAEWQGRDLPTEAEWEYAARGGGAPTEYAWGSERAPDGIEQANTWQGMFPVRNLATDGYAGIAPVGQFPANGFGAFDMIGNVWEWTRSRPTNGRPGAELQRTIKGGSYLCAPNYCARYRPAAKQAQEIGLGTNHVGFRTVRRRCALCRVTRPK